jgi:hypothetical protein
VFTRGSLDRASVSEQASRKYRLRSLAGRVGGGSRRMPLPLSAHDPHVRRDVRTALIPHWFCTKRLGGVRPAMGRHVSNYDLLSGWLPKIIYPEASGRVSRVPTILNVPVCRITLPLPLKIELVFTAVLIVYSIFHQFTSKATASSHPTVAGLIR